MGGTRCAPTTTDACVIPNNDLWKEQSLKKHKGLGFADFIPTLLLLLERSQRKKVNSGQTLNCEFKKCLFTIQGLTPDTIQGLTPDTTKNLIFVNQAYPDPIICIFLMVSGCFVGNKRAERLIGVECLFNNHKIDHLFK